MTYTLIDRGIHSATQIFPCDPLTADYCGVVVNGVTYLNVYKEPNDPTAIRTLLSWDPPRRSIAASDFNAVHCAWQPEATYPRGQGIEIERWAERHNLTCLTVGEPMHRAGNTLDLAWTNINGAQAWVGRSECITSDHLPIRGQVPTGCGKWDHEPSPIRVTRGNSPRFSLAVAQFTHPPLVLDTVHKADEYAKDLCSGLTNAIKAAGTRRNTRHGKCAPWWTPEYKLARTEYRAAVNPEQ